MPPKPLTPDIAAFLQSGHLLTLATQGADGIPAMAPALACQVAPDRESVMVYLDVEHAGRALADIVANGRVSLLCAMPAGPHAVILKGLDAQPASPATDAALLVERHREALAAEWLMLGFPAEFGYALTDSHAERLTALRFTPSQCERRQANGWTV
jgi:predicted pyridoxine 5'-phosphate oxidase superfamily flavin-nucleotide-binding protein